MLNEIFEDTQKRMLDSIKHLKKDFGSLRTGRANAALLDNIRVPYYGTDAPLNQVASISVPENSLIVVQPWDAAVVPEVEKAILKSDLGLTPASDGKIIRLPIPPLTEERREQLARQAKKIAEEFRIAVRNIRRSANELIKDLMKEKEISEDDAHRGYDRVQEMTDKNIEQIDEILKKKEHEIRED